MIACVHARRERSGHWRWTADGGIVQLLHAALDACALAHARGVHLLWDERQQKDFLAEMQSTDTTGWAFSWREKTNERRVSPPTSAGPGCCVLQSIQYNGFSFLLQLSLSVMIWVGPWLAIRQEGKGESVYC